MTLQMLPPPTVHPIVCPPPDSVRRRRFGNEHVIIRIVGLPDDESRQILDDLFAFATRADFVYRHRWPPHDLVFWDNRSLQHLATGCPADQRRRLNRTAIERGVPA